MPSWNGFAGNVLAALKARATSQVSLALTHLALAGLIETEIGIAWQVG